MTQPKMSSCLSKGSYQIMTLLCICSSVSSFGTIFAHTFLMSRSSVKIFLTFSADVHLLCYALDSQPTIFTNNLTHFCNVFFSSASCWPSWSLFVSDTFSSTQKNFLPTCKLLFSSQHYPLKLALTSLWFLFHSFQV